MRPRHPASAVLQHSQTCAGGRRSKRLLPATSWEAGVLCSWVNLTIRHPVCQVYCCSCKLVGGAGGGPSSQSGFPCSQVVGQPNASDAQEQTGYYACAYIGQGPGPLAGFQHLGGFPAETGKGGVSAEEADGDGHAPVWR